MASHHHRAVDRIAIMRRAVVMGDSKAVAAMVRALPDGAALKNLINASAAADGRTLVHMSLQSLFMLFSSESAAMSEEQLATAAKKRMRILKMLSRLGGGAINCPVVDAVHYRLLSATSYLLEEVDADGGLRECLQERDAYGQHVLHAAAGEKASGIARRLLLGGSSRAALRDVGAHVGATLDQFHRQTTLPLPSLNDAIGAEDVEALVGAARRALSGADGYRAWIDARDRRGRAPLHLACRAGGPRGARLAAWRCGAHRSRRNGRHLRPSCGESRACGALRAWLDHSFDGAARAALLSAADAFGRSMRTDGAANHTSWAPCSSLVEWPVAATATAAAMEAHAARRSRARRSHSRHHHPAAAAFHRRPISPGGRRSSPDRLDDVGGDAHVHFALRPRGRVASIDVDNLTRPPSAGLRVAQPPMPHPPRRRALARIVAVVPRVRRRPRGRHRGGADGDAVPAQQGEGGSGGSASGGAAGARRRCDFLPPPPRNQRAAAAAARHSLGRHNATSPRRRRRRRRLSSTVACSVRADWATTSARRRRRSAWSAVVWCTPALHLATLAGAHPHFHGAVYNAAIVGRRRWALVPPAAAQFALTPALELFARLRDGTRRR